MSDSWFILILVGLKFVSSPPKSDLKWTVFEKVPKSVHFYFQDFLWPDASVQVVLPLPNPIFQVFSVLQSILTSGFQYMTTMLLLATRVKESLKCLHTFTPFLIMLTMICWENVTINLCWLLVSCPRSLFLIGSLFSWVLSSDWSIKVNLVLVKLSTPSVSFNISLLSPPLVKLRKLVVTVLHPSKVAVPLKIRLSLPILQWKPSVMPRPLVMIIHPVLVNSFEFILVWLVNCLLVILILTFWKSHVSSSNWRNRFYHYHVGIILKWAVQNEKKGRFLQIILRKYRWSTHWKRTVQMSYICFGHQGFESTFDLWTVHFHRPQFDEWASILINEHPFSAWLNLMTIRSLYGY